MVNNFRKKIIVTLVSIFFLLGVSNVYALTLSSSENVSVSARVGEDVVVTSTIGSLALPQTAVRFSGQAYPNAQVTLLKQGEKTAVVKANAAGDFNIMLAEQYNSNILYSLFAEDVSGNRSILINYPIAVQVGFLTYLSGIRFAPTIVTDKAEVKKGGYLTVSGYALPKKDMEVSVEGKENRVFTLISSIDGSYKIVLPLLDMPNGDYGVRIKYIDDSRISKLVDFSIGESDIFNTDTLLNIPGDCNADRVINLVDFSVLAFWYGKNNPPACVDTSKDNKIDLVDFSIVAFWWTG
jgi:hypothetical protein